MAPFTHISPDRPSRFSDGSFGILYVGHTFEVALLETMHHHGRFMQRTSEPPDWTAQFREIVMDVAGTLHDLRPAVAERAAVLDPDDSAASQALTTGLRTAGSDGLVYPSVRAVGGTCAALFYPDLAAHAVPGRHLDYHWNGQRVDLYRDAGRQQVYRVG